MLININPNTASMLIHVLKHAGWARSTGPDEFYWHIQVRFDALEPVLHIPGEHSLDVQKWFRREAEVALIPFNKWNWEDLIHAMDATVTHIRIWDAVSMRWKWEKEYEDKP